MQTKVTEKLKGFWEKVKGLFLKLNKVTRIVLGICAVAILVAIIAGILTLNKKEYAVLYTGLNTTEIGTIGQFLNDNGMSDYQIKGDTILVPAGRETQLQAQLALSGYPTSGFLYEYLSGHTGSLSTDNERDQAFLIATQERLAAIIRQFNGVQEAWVTISPGTDRFYVLDPNVTPATASVMLSTKDNKQVDSNVADAIRLLVSHSVKNLDVSNVELTDGMGNPYTDNDVFTNMSDANSLKLQFEQETNTKIRTDVYEALRSIYGDDNVRVTARSTASVDRRVINSTSYEQPAGSVEGGGLIGSEKWFMEWINDDGELVGGTVGTSTNSNLPTYPDLEPNLEGDETYYGAQGERLHNINEINEQREVLAATITDASVSVTINGNCANANVLTAEEIRGHVATAAGIRGDDLSNYVSVVIAPFDNTVPYQPGDPTNPREILPGVPNWILLAAIGGLLLFIILLVIILVLRSRAKKKRLAQQQALEEMQAAEALAAAAAAAEIPAPTGGADIMEINTEKSMELRKTVRQFAQNNPEIAAQMVRAWLRGGEEDNG